MVSPWTAAMVKEAEKALLEQAPAESPLASEPPLLDITGIPNDALIDKMDNELLIDIANLKANASPAAGEGKDTMENDKEKPLLDKKKLLDEAIRNKVPVQLDQ